MNAYTPSKYKFPFIPEDAGPELSFTVYGGAGLVRKGYLVQLWSQDLAYIAASDPLTLKPRHFVVQKAIDWEVYLNWLAQAWKYGKRVPYCFKTQGRLPPPVVENFEKMDFTDRVQLIRHMESTGVIPAVKALTAKTVPYRWTLPELRAHFIRTSGGRASQCLLFPASTASDADLD
jgi:hypothetical protein